MNSASEVLFFTHEMTTREAIKGNEEYKRILLATYLVQRAGLGGGGGGKHDKYLVFWIWLKTRSTLCRRSNQIMLGTLIPAESSRNKQRKHYQTYM